ncbi:hypothetical protein KRMM14A1004_24280 [Krasilnikovia sp. MM14-A1004]
MTTFEEGSSEGSAHPRPENCETFPCVLDLKQGVRAVFPAVLDQHTRAPTLDKSVHNVAEEGDDAGTRDVAWRDRFRGFDECLPGGVVLGQRNVKVPLLACLLHAVPTRTR